MKKIIDGKLYDTEKAILITKYFEKIKHEGYICNLYPYHHISIYKTKKGVFFKHIGEPKNKGWDNNKQDLVIMTEAEVKEILNKLNEIEKYIELFGEVEEA